MRQLKDGFISHRTYVVQLSLPWENAKRWKWHILSQIADVINASLQRRC